MITNLDKFTFTTKNGKLLSSQTVVNGNMVGYTAQLVFLTCDNPQANNFLPGYHDYLKGLMDLEEGHIGAYSRYEQPQTNTSVDDYLAATTIYSNAVTVLHRGRGNLGFLDINELQHSSFAQWLFRFQGFWNNARIAAGEQIGLIGQLAWSISLVIAARQPISNQDNWIESALMVVTKERYLFRSWICDLAIKYWRKKKGSTKIADIQANYLGIPDHPLVQAWAPYG